MLWSSLNTTQRQTHTEANQGLQVSRHIWIQFEEKQCNYWRAPTSQISLCSSTISHTQTQKELTWTVPFKKGNYADESILKQHRRSNPQAECSRAKARVIGNSLVSQSTTQQGRSHNVQGELKVMGEIILCMIINCRISKLKCWLVPKIKVLTFKCPYKWSWRLWWRQNLPLWNP